jgi:hypothetical protein
MGQYDFGTIDPATKSGSELANDLNHWRNAVHMLHRGSARPGYALPGTLWLREVSNALWELLLFTGTHDVKLGDFNPVSGTTVFASNIAHRTLTEWHIALHGIHGHNIAHGHINGDHVGHGQINGDHIAHGHIGHHHIAGHAVHWWQIAPGHINGDHVAHGHINGHHIAHHTIGGHHVAHRTLSEWHIAQHTIGGHNIAPGAVGGVNAGAGADVFFGTSGDHRLHFRRIRAETTSSGSGSLVWVSLDVYVHHHDLVIRLTRHYAEHGGGGESP